MALTTVIFDFYGTLAEADTSGPSWEDLFRAMGHEMSSEASRRLWYGGADGIEHHEHSRSRDHYVAWQHARVREIIAASGVPQGDDDMLFSQITERLGSTDLEAYEETRPVLEALRARGFRIAICSNWDWDLLEAIDSAGLSGFADVTVSSAWVGVRKPHPQIFTDTLDRLGIDPSEALFVGDTWTCDVEGPRALGMEPVYLRRPHFGNDHTAPEQPDPTVTRTTDLNIVPDLLGRS
jgi:putative hydrolase of the HAD superfamily